MTRSNNEDDKIKNKFNSAKYLEFIWLNNMLCTFIL